MKLFFCSQHAEWLARINGKCCYNKSHMEQVFSIIFLIFAAASVLFLPGLAVSFLFFDRGKIDILERIALSFALSISIVPLLTFYANLLGAKINVSLIFIIIFGVCYLSLTIYVIKWYRARKKSRKSQHLPHK